MKIKTKKTTRVYVLTLSADEAEALYLAISSDQARDLVEADKKAKYQTYADEIEYALSDAMYG